MREFLSKSFNDNKKDKTKIGKDNRNDRTKNKNFDAQDVIDDDDYRV